MEMTLKPWVIVIIIAGLIFFHMSLMSNAEQSDVAKGKVLFHDPSLGESKNANSCNTCPPNGRGLENTGDKKEFRIMGMKQNSLEEAVNVCIEKPLQGKAIDPKGQEMAHIVTYLKSLKK
jgi:cytochrome c peroxidase